MKRLMNYIGILLLIGSIFGCTDERLFNGSNGKLRVTGSVETATRTNYAVGDESVTVSWAAGDMIGLFSEEQPDAVCYRAAAEGKQADFMPEGARLKNEEGTEVYAYYPYETYGSENDVYPYAPLPYLFGQNYNDGMPVPNTDFMYAKGEILNGELSLNFKHLFAFLKLNIRTELLKDAQGLFIRSNEPIAYGNYDEKQVCYDLKEDTLVADIKYDYLWYYFPEEALETQETITCYMAVLPTSEKNVITVFIHHNDGNYEQGLFEKKAPEGGFQAGHVYDLSVESNEFDKIIKQEREALIALYQATGGENWKDNTNWCSDKPLDEWYGVSYWDGHVRSLNLWDNNLTGQIPEELGNLTAIDWLNLGSNRLEGSIPECIGNLHSLRTLDLMSNSLSGEIPSFIGNLSALEYLYLDNNRLVGGIPECIGDLSHLKYLNLANNMLSGEIPVSIGNMVLLNGFYAYENQLCGELPVSIGNLTSLVDLNMQNNELTGNLPASMAQLNKLEYLNLCGNRLNGTIPDEILNCDWWKRLGISTVYYQKDGNKISFPLYESSDYSMDGVVTTLQKHTVGSGLKVVILGEAYTDRLITDGTYRKHAEMAMEAFFSEEPYASFRNYFDFYMVNVVSRNEILGENTVFETSYEFERNTFETNPTKAIEYVSAMAETNYTAKDITSIILMNTSAPFRSNCWMFGDGFSAAFCLCNGTEEAMTSLIHHEVCGHGFAKLDDEYTEFEGTYPYPESIPPAHAVNESMNVDVTDDPQEVVWSYFLTDMRYEKEKIGIYEGAIYYPKGAYRATENSIMRYNTGGFNAPSRQSIYRRIMEKSGGVYSFEDFLEYDEINRQRIENEGTSRAGTAKKGLIGLPPIKCDYPSSEVKYRLKKGQTINVPLR